MSSLKSVEVTNEVLSSWANGSFNGPNALANTKKLAHKDCFIDATANMKNTDIYRRYDGIDGWLAWCEALTILNFLEFSFEVFAGHTPNTAVARMSYRVQHRISGKSSPCTMTDFLEFTVGEDDGLVRSAVYFFGSPNSMDEIFS